VINEALKNLSRQIRGCPQIQLFKKLSERNFFLDLEAQEFVDFKK